MPMSVISRQTLWTPERISPALWLDAADSSTITTVDGGVSEWRDKSGNNRHAAQSTAEDRPLLFSGGLNGTDVLRFDGINDFLLGTTLADNTFSVFVICTFNQLNQPGGDYDYLFSIGPNSPGAFLGLARWSTDNRFYAYDAGGIQYGPALTGQTPILINFISKTAPNYFELFYDGVNQTIGQLLSSVSINGKYHVGRLSFSNEHYLNGDISQIVVFNRVLTQVEREKMEGYLAWSTGLQGNLPVGHPYKNYPPRGL